MYEVRQEKALEGGKSSHQPFLDISKNLKRIFGSVANQTTSFYWRVVYVPPINVAKNCLHVQFKPGSLTLQESNYRYSWLSLV